MTQTTKLSRQEVIAQLKQLKEGDILIAGKGSGWFNPGEKHPVYQDRSGNLYVKDNDGDSEYINDGSDYEMEVLGRVLDGVLILPETPKPFSIVLGSEINIGDNITEIRVLVDGPGRERLDALVAESRVATQLPKLLAQKAELEQQIEALTKGAN